VLAKAGVGYSVLEFDSRQFDESDHSKKEKRTMRSILIATASVALFAGLCLAETFTGKLVDASCVAQKTATSCAPTDSTTMYAIDVSGKIYRLDDSGNTKAADAIKNQANRESSPDSAKKAERTARVSGTLDGDVIKVETIEVR
jgi:hypothetical protein